MCTSCGCGCVHVCVTHVGVYVFADHVSVSVYM